MSDMYLTVNPIEGIDPKKLRVYGVEKGKEEQHSYAKAAQTVSMKKTGKAEAAGVGAEYGERREAPSPKYAGDIYSEMTQVRNLSLEDRKQQLAFEKGIQGSRARTMRAAAAYESSFMVY